VDKSCGTASIISNHIILWAMMLSRAKLFSINCGLVWHDVGVVKFSDFFRWESIECYQFVGWLPRAFSLESFPPHQMSGPMESFYGKYSPLDRDHTMDYPIKRYNFIIMFFIELNFQGLFISPILAPREGETV
jgi:hypothetical protein